MLTLLTILFNMVAGVWSWLPFTALKTTMDITSVWCIDIVLFKTNVTNFAKSLFAEKTVEEFLTVFVHVFSFKIFINLHCRLE